MKRITVEVFTKVISLNEPLMEVRNNFRCKFYSYGFTSFESGFEFLKVKKIDEYPYLPDVILVRNDVRISDILEFGKEVSRFDGDILWGVLSLAKKSTDLSRYKKLGASYVGSELNFLELDKFLCSIPDLKQTIADKYPIP